MEYVLDKTMQFINVLSNGNLSPNCNADKIRRSVELFADSVVMVSKLLPSLLKVGKGFNRSDEEFVEKMKERVKEPLKAVQVSRYICLEEVPSMLRHISQLDSTLAAKYTMFMLTQKSPMTGRAESNLYGICRTIEYSDDKEGVLYMDPMLLGTIYMISDVSKVTQRTLSETNNESIGDIMNVLFDPWAQKKRVNFRKKIALAMAVMEGIDENDVDASMLCEGVVSRLGVDGHFLENFAKGLKNKQLQKGYKKRAPNGQPVVVVAPSSGSDEYVNRGVAKKSGVSASNESVLESD